MNVKKPPVVSISATSYDKRHLRRPAKKDVREIPTSPSLEGKKKCKLVVKERQGCRLEAKVRDNITGFANVLTYSLKLMWLLKLT